MAIIQGRWYSTYTSSKIKQTVVRIAGDKKFKRLSILQLVPPRQFLDLDMAGFLQGFFFHQTYLTLYKQYLNLSGS